MFSFCFVPSDAFTISKCLCVLGIDLLDRPYTEAAFEESSCFKLSYPLGITLSSRNLEKDELQSSLLSFCFHISRQQRDSVSCLSRGRTSIPSNSVPQLHTEFAPSLGLHPIMAVQINLGELLREFQSDLTFEK